MYKLDLERMDVLKIAGGNGGGQQGSSIGLQATLGSPKAAAISEDSTTLYVAVGGQDDLAVSFLFSSWDSCT